MFDLSAPIQLPHLLTPLIIFLVGIAQVAMIYCGIQAMREAAKARNKQVDAMTDTQSAMAKALLDMGNGINDSARGIRELLQRAA